MSKRGMSTVVTSLILILIAIVVLSILGVIINSLIKDKGDQFITDQFTTDLIISNVQVLSDTEMKVTVKRNPGEGNVVGVAFIAYDFNGSEVIRKNVNLSELQEKDFQIILQVVNASLIEKIAIAPIFGLDSGKESTGQIQYERDINGEGRAIPSGGSGGGEVPPETPPENPVETNDCDLTQATWDKNFAIEGEKVLMSITGTNCDGKIISFEIFDKDGFLDSDDKVTTAPLNLTFNENISCTSCVNDTYYYWCPLENLCDSFSEGPRCYENFVSKFQGTCPTEVPLTNHFSFVWEAIYEEDSSILGNSNPEYYFVASVIGSEETIESSNDGVDDPLLLVVQQLSATCEDGEQNGDETGFDCGGSCDSCPTLRWEYEGREVTVLNDIEYGDSINLVLENTGLDPTTEISLDIFDSDNVGEDDPVDTVVHYIESEGATSIGWVFNEETLNSARDLLEGDRLELYFVFNENYQSRELDINFINPIVVNPPVTENCSDGIKNQDEFRVDCGGVCGLCLSACQECLSGGGLWCFAPSKTIIPEDYFPFCGSDIGECFDAGLRATLTCETCNDGIRNQFEEEVDCGGPNCDPCPSCSDGIQNQDEELVDCGGPNCPLCECVSSQDCAEIELYDSYYDVTYSDNIDCVQGYCQECDESTTGLGCSSHEFPWQEGTCSLRSGNYWICNRYPIISYDKNTGLHHWRSCSAGSLCATNTDGDSGGDFVAEGVCTGGIDSCDVGELAIKYNGGSYIRVEDGIETRIFYDKYYGDCSEVGTLRSNPDILCDSDVGSPTVGFNWDGICNCGVCQTSSTNPCSDNYNSLDKEILKQELLEEVNWEREWVMGGNGVVKMFCYDPEVYPSKNCFWREFTPRSLTLDQGISEASRLHSQDMADNNYIFDKDELFTNGPSNLAGLTAEQRIAQAGYTCSGAWEITDRIYVREGMNEADVSYYLTRGNGGPWYDNPDENIWFGNRYLEYDGEGNPSNIDYERYEIYPPFSIRYWIATENAEFDTAGVGVARAHDGQLYVTFTFCNNEKDDYVQYPIDEDPRCDYNFDPPIPWCDGNYNNHPHCYDYWSLYESLGGKEDMSLEQQNLGFYCMQWNPFPTLSLNYSNGVEVLIGDVIRVPTTLTFNMRSPLFFNPGETLSFEIWDEDTLGDDYIETISGVVREDYSVSIEWNFDQGVVDAASNWGEGDTFEIYFKFFSEETTRIELGHS